MRSTPLLVLVGLAGLAVGVVVGWTVLPPREDGATPAGRPEAAPEPPRSVTVPPGEAEGASGTGSLRGNPEARIAELEEERTRLERRVRELEAVVAKEQASKPKPQPGAFRFGVPEDGKRFDAADWTALGGHIRAMTEGLVGLPADLARGGQPSAKVRAAMAHNEPLATFALDVAGELEGTGGNGAFTHPAVLANLIRAILREAGDPLMDAQEAAISPLGEAAAKDLAKPADPAAVALAATVHEVEVKQRFLREVRALLTPSQDGILFRPETEGRLQLDLLSPGLILFTIRDDVTAATVAEVETKLLKTLFDYAGFDPPDAEALRWIAHDWVEATPGAKEPIPARSPDALFPKVDVVVASARAQLVAIDRVLSRGSWTDEQRKSLLGLRGVLHPQVVTPP